MVGEKIRSRISARQDGAKALISDISRSVRETVGDIVERIDLDTNVPKSTPEIITDAGRRFSKVLINAEKRFAANNRRGIK